MKLKTLPLRNLLLYLLFFTSIFFPDRQAFADEKNTNRGEVITVTADFVEQQQNRVASSITVFSEDEIEQLAEQHFEELINWVPNLNFAGGSSRPRYFQIRGIGERSQYQGAPNPSVGFIIDDIDFSGMGGIATTFDTAQIEVLRGPQGSRYGANALAGLIYIRTAEPDDVFRAKAEFSYAEDNTFSSGIAAGGPLSDQLAYRLSVQQYNSDGFRKNLFLNRTDTNEKDEFSSHLKLRWTPGENWTINTALIKVKLNNGYDAWAADNSLFTQSDKPGRDEQDTLGASVKINWDGNQNVRFSSISSYAKSDVLFSFDGDWGNPVLWGVNGPYDFTSETVRNRKTTSQEFRFNSKESGRLFSGKMDWVAGLYFLNLDESNAILDLFNGGIYNQLNSDYSANSHAVFAELNYHFSEVTSLKYGLRVEQRKSDYVDSNGQDLSPSDSMTGGHLTLEHLHQNGIFTYATIAKGYKAGGFNIGTNIPANRTEFGNENLWNFELGAKASFFDDRLFTSLSAFYMKRKNQQVETSFQDNPSDPLSFTFFTDNAASGTNKGLEFTSEYQITPRWRWISSVGLLLTQFDRYTVGTRNLAGRQQAHAPKYNYATALNYENDKGVFALLEISGKDSFYYSNSHDQVSKSYNLVNFKLGYEQKHWRWFIWGKNILNKKYTVRGFFFANEPPDWIEKLYTRQGNPSQWGLTINYNYE